MLTPRQPEGCVPVVEDAPLVNNMVNKMFAFFKLLTTVRL